MLRGSQESARCESKTGMMTEKKTKQRSRDTRQSCPETGTRQVCRGWENKYLLKEPFILVLPELEGGLHNHTLLFKVGKRNTRGKGLIPPSRQLQTQTPQHARSED